MIGRPWGRYRLRIADLAYPPTMARLPGNAEPTSTSRGWLQVRRVYAYSLGEKMFVSARRLSRHVLLCCFVAVTVLSTGCATHVASDYPQYLEKNAGDSNLPSTDRASAYYLPPRTAALSYEFRAFSTGVANKWVVDIGEMLDDTLQSRDVQTAFNGLRKVADANAASDGLLTFALQTYSFNDFAAQISMHVTLQAGGRERLSKVYESSGKSQMGKMMLAGAFGQKNAVQQSTKAALDDILRQLINDINALSD
ncbi:hypothetical protein [Salinisphaera sp. S4-8]|uniref:hypothetical protein n=1 Tax=Salinisphaera sp. S4-8 TaxID=633357 RepID=UPI00333E32D8